MEKSFYLYRVISWEYIKDQDDYEKFIVPQFGKLYSNLYSAVEVAIDDVIEIDSYVSVNEIDQSYLKSLQQDSDETIIDLLEPKNYHGDIYYELDLTITPNGQIELAFGTEMTDYTIVIWKLKLSK